MPRPTILTGLFACTIVFLFGVIQNYLAQGSLIAIDTRIVNLVSTIQKEWIIYTFSIITLAADPIVIIAASVIIITFLLVRRRYLYFVGFCIALTTSEAVTFLGKIFFRRERPNAFFQTFTDGSFSFPSGHATTVMVFYGFLAYLVVKNFPSLRVRIAAILATIIIVLLVDVSRLYLGVHYFSDVIAGNLVGLAGLLLAIGIIKQRNTRSLTAPSSNDHIRSTI